MADVPPVPPAPSEGVPPVPVPPSAAQLATPTAPLPADPAASTAPIAADPVAPKKRPVWPWVLGGGIVLLVLLIVGVIVLVSNLLGGLIAGGGNASGEPAQAVLAYDQSFEDADCDLFIATTTESFRESFFGGDFDCAAWVENAEALTVDGVYLYEVEVTATEVDGDAAEVTTTETDSSSGEGVDYELRYYLVGEGGSWLVDSIENETAP